MALLHPVILSGGVGSRLWPLSRSLFPKQLLALAGDNSLIQDTVRRAAGPAFAAPLIICNVEHRFLIAEQMRAAGQPPGAIILEPAGRNTAPAAAIAALMLAEKDPDAILLVMPADHVVRDLDAFRRAADSAAAAAAQGFLVTFGIAPRGPETGYGYVQRGALLSESAHTFAVRRFVEKPDVATAQSYIEAGDYYWNSGMFAFRAESFLAELERLEPGILANCRAAIQGGKQDLDFFRLEPKAFEACKSISIDYAVMEHTQKAAIVPVEMGWSDIGSWEALWDASDKDNGGNALKGDVLHHATRNSYLRSEGPLIAAVGVEDLVIVATKDAVLVSRKDASQDVKKIVEQLNRSGRELHVTHRKVFRPWGAYESLDIGENFQVKRITVNPGAKLSLQMHHKRAEHWVVVSGTARVTRGGDVFTLGENESTFIPLGTKHRLENIGSGPLHLIEVQSGRYLGEDDIVRFEDSYGR
ncbi:MAG: mannose-1-phosphate guanylyltransferase/mannose-6-phosphate isomerase [Alphaproteobacteria bacterium]|nr:mannose-1-phosphate guanylyltransferase/mannose-6-phosphate isomerase [Alphaproteobacteria bacterium]